MSTTRYYRVSHPEALDALHQYQQRKAELHQACEAFAAQYPGAKPAFGFSVHGSRFLGLRFDPAEANWMWTRPEPRSGDVQRPRRTLPAAMARKGREARATALSELRQLLKRWDDTYPKLTDSSMDGVWRAIGTHWGDLLFSGIGFFVDPGNKAWYVATSATLDPRCEEVTGGVYEAARVAGKAARA